MGKEATVVKSDWNGRVKVRMDEKGVAKSYLPKELEVFIKETIGDPVVEDSEYWKLIKQPLWKRIRDDHCCACCRRYFAQRVDGHKAHLVLLFLMAVDVVAVAVELILYYTRCGKCPNNRPGYTLEQIVCDANFDTIGFNQNQAYLYNNAHNISVGVLLLMLIQVFLCMLCYGVLFFKSFFYISDTLIIVLSLLLETVFHKPEGGFIVVLLGE
jgi:hypothetical protein